MVENNSLQYFDWDAEEAQSKGVKNEELINKYDKSLNAIKNQEVVEGTVMSINKREVVVNVGYKSDGIVPAAEFRYNPDLKVGDKVEVFIKKLEDSYGVKFFTRRPRLSLTPEGEAMLRYISRLNVLGVDLKVIHDIPLLLGHEGSRTTFGVQENMQQ